MRLLSQSILLAVLINSLSFSPVAAEISKSPFSTQEEKVLSQPLKDVKAEDLQEIVDAHQSELKDAVREQIRDKGDMEFFVESSDSTDKEKKFEKIDIEEVLLAQIDTAQKPKLDLTKGLYATSVVEGIKIGTKFKLGEFEGQKQVAIGITNAEFTETYARTSLSMEMNENGSARENAILIRSALESTAKIAAKKIAKKEREAKETAGKKIQRAIETAVNWVIPSAKAHQEPNGLDTPSFLAVSLLVVIAMGLTVLLSELFNRLVLRFITGYDERMFFPGLERRTLVIGLIVCVVIAGGLLLFIKNRSERK